MPYLLTVSLIWAFSFSLIKGILGTIDPYFISFARMALSMLVFLPFLRKNSIRGHLGIGLFFTGMIQYGVMYLAYIYSFKWLKAGDVALFTILTPLYVTLINDLLERHFNGRYLLAAVLAIAGTAIISLENGFSMPVIHGFALVQLSNLAFAAGQIVYRRLMTGDKVPADRDVFGIMYLGAVVLTGLVSLCYTDYSKLVLSPDQVLTLVYLGIIASGLCFFLWNAGARKTGAGTLAVFNDLKIPLAIIVAMTFFGEKHDPLRLITGSSVILLGFMVSRSGEGNSMGSEPLSRE